CRRRCGAASRRSATRRTSTRRPSATGSLIGDPKTGKFSSKGANCFCPVANRVLHFRGQFGKGVFESIRNENRIVAKSMHAARLFDDRARYNSFKRPEQFALSRQRDHAAKSCRSFRSSYPDAPELAEYLVDLLLIARIFPRVAGRENSRRAAERINF